MLTGIHDPFELNLLHRPPLIATPVDGLRMDLELVRMIHKQDTNPTKSIDIKMHQVIVMTRDGMVSDNREVHILVDQREQFVHVLFQILE